MQHIANNKTTHGMAGLPQVCAVPHSGSAFYHHRVHHALLVYTGVECGGLSR